MTEAILTAALLNFGGQCRPAQARRIAAVIAPAARRRRLDPLLMVAVVLHESGGTCRHAVRWERAGGCSIGPFQIYSRRCDQKRWKRLQRAAIKAAYILDLGRKRCQAAPRSAWYCRNGQWWARYNPGSRRWALGVAEKWRRLRQWAEQRKTS